MCVCVSMCVSVCVSVCARVPRWWIGFSLASINLVTAAALYTP